ncbi:MAG TPA: aquaporin [Thiobacillaceae bacterium]|nr:aquaporin [Thiobacillaceae bacterium]
MAAPSARPGAAASLGAHWPEYLMEAAELGLFMVSACLCVALVEHPASPVRQALDDGLLRRALIGLAMGITAVAIVHSPLGRRSGAHFNPAVTLTFWRLGKIEAWDALFYCLAQCLGGVLGVIVSLLLLGQPVVADPSVNYVVTVPGGSGRGVAFVAEAAMSFVLMLTVLTVSNRRHLNRYTALFAGSLVALFITLEAPLSGMSMNPARTLGSAWPAQVWTALWLYLTAPPLGMLLAAELYVRRRGVQAVLCAKLHHDNPHRCIFRCGYGEHPEQTQ